MAKSFFQLNYDQLASIAKTFKDEGEDTARLHSATRQRVRDLHSEWAGEAAEKFFEEMETELLPAVQRLAQALFLTQDVTNDIMKIIHEADEDTVGFFRNQLSGDDFGAGLFGQALDGMPAGSSAPEDFGAGKFGDALGGNPPGGDGTSAPDDFGAAKFGEATDQPASGPGESGTPGDHDSTQGSEREGGGSEKSAKDKTPETETTPAGGGGGGSSSSSSQGLKGDLKNMGVGLSNQAPQTASAGGDASPRTADHIYSDSGSPKPEESPTPKGDGSKPGVDTGSGESGQSSSVGGAGAAAGAAGAAAAAGGAAKAVKGKAKKNAK